MYPFEEQVDMILIYGECQQNSVQARILYSERYPNRILPSRRTFKNVCDKLRQTGSLNTRKSDREKKVGRIQACIDNNGHHFEHLL